MDGFPKRHARGVPVLAWAAASFSLATHALAAPFGPGNLVVLQIGASGSAAPLTNAGTAVFLQEFSPAGGAAIQTLPLPTTVLGMNQPLTISGTAGSEGELSLSANGQYLVVAGYDVGVGTATQGTSTIGLVNAGGVVDTSTTTNLLSGNNTRGAASSDGSQLWITGPKGLINLTADTTTGGTNVDSGVNLDGLVVAPAAVSPSGSTALFGSSGKSPHGIVQFGSALPSATTTGANLTGMSSSTSPAPYAFFFANPTTLFVADGSNGLQEWVDSSGTWSVAATYNGSGNSYVGLTGVESGSTVDLYATTGASGGGWTEDNNLISIPFTFSSGTSGVGIFNTATVLATATGDSGFAGVAFTPTAVPEPASFALALGVSAGLWRRRQPGRPA